MESGQKFASPKEEIDWLKRQLQEKLKEAEKFPLSKETAVEPVKEAAKEVIKEYSAQPFEQTLALKHKLSEKEIGARVLELKPEIHDRQIEELLGILEERGIANAISVSRGLGPHIEDDFHRVLVQYLLGQMDKPEFKSSSDLSLSLGMVLYEIIFRRSRLKRLCKKEKLSKIWFPEWNSFTAGLPFFPHRLKRAVLNYFPSRSRILFSNSRCRHWEKK